MSYFFRYPNNFSESDICPRGSLFIKEYYFEYLLLAKMRDKISSNCASCCKSPILAVKRIACSGYMKKSGSLAKYPVDTLIQDENNSKIKQKKK